MKMLFLIVGAIPKFHEIVVVFLEKLSKFMGD